MHVSDTNSVNVNNKRFTDTTKLYLFGEGSIADRIKEEAIDLYPHLQIEFGTPEISLKKLEDPKTSYLITTGFLELDKRVQFFNLFSSVYTPAFLNPHLSKSSSSVIKSGAIFLGQASIGMKSVIGAHNLIFPGVVIEPEVSTGANVLIGPGAIICQECKIGNNVLIGAGAIILPGVEIKEGATIGAGALIRSSVSAFDKVVGIPARRLD